MQKRQCIQIIHDSKTGSRPNLRNSVLGLSFTQIINPGWLQGYSNMCSLPGLTNFHVRRYPYPRGQDLPQYPLIFYFLGGILGYIFPLAPPQGKNLKSLSPPLGAKVKTISPGSPGGCEGKELNHPLCFGELNWFLTKRFLSYKKRVLFIICQ